MNEKGYWDPYASIICPYDPVHVITAQRFQRHVLKCKKNHPEKDLVQCPFNAKHFVMRGAICMHLASCVDKPPLENNIIKLTLPNSKEPQSMRGNISMPKPKQIIMSEEEEDWDKEIGLHSVSSVKMDSQLGNSKQNPLLIDKFNLKNTEIVGSNDVSPYSEYSEASSSSRYVKPSKSTTATSAAPPAPNTLPTLATPPTPNTLPTSATLPTPTRYVIPSKSTPATSATPPAPNTLPTSATPPTPNTPPTSATPPTPGMQTSEVPGNSNFSRTIGRGYLKETISKFHSLRIGH